MKSWPKGRVELEKSITDIWLCINKEQALIPIATENIKRLFSQSTTLLSEYYFNIYLSRGTRCLQILQTSLNIYSNCRIWDPVERHASRTCKLHLKCHGIPLKTSICTCILDYLRSDSYGERFI